MFEIHLHIRADGFEWDGPVTLANVANGPWVGGMFHIAPMARNDDGALELLIAAPVSRTRICALLPGLMRLRYLTLRERFSIARALRQLAREDAAEDRETIGAWLTRQGFEDQAGFAVGPRVQNVGRLEFVSHRQSIAPGGPSLRNRTASARVRCPTSHG